MIKKIALFILLATSVNITAQTVTLKDNSKEGETFKVKTESLQKSPKMGAMTLTHFVNKTITKSDDTEITAELVVERLLVNISQGGATYGYDSKVENPISQMGKVLKQQFDPMAKVTMITTLDRFGTMKKSETIPPSGGVSMGAFQFGYPTEPIKVGSTWSSDFMNMNVGKIKLSYKVTKITDTTVYIEFTGVSVGSNAMRLEGNMEVDIATGNQNKVVSRSSMETLQGNVKGKTTITSTKN